MKKLRKSWLRASIIIVLLVGVFVTLNAMKEAAPQQVETEIQLWYFYENVNQDCTNPENYQLTPVKACNGGTDVICIIQAIEDPANLDQPLITDEASRDILQALADKMPTHNIVISLRSR